MEKVWLWLIEKSMIDFSKKNEENITAEKHSFKIL